MTHSKSKLNTNEIPAFRKFLEARGFKCRDGKGDWQALQVQNITDRGWKAFCFNTKGVVTSPVEFDALIQVFKAPIDPSETFYGGVRIDKIFQGVHEEDLSPSSHDSDLLDDFAIAALSGMCANDNLILRFNETGKKEMIGPDSLLATAAYGIARAMMAERSHHQPK